MRSWSSARKLSFAPRLEALGDRLIPTARSFDAGTQILDVTDDGRDDLAVGVPFEDASKIRSTKVDSRQVEIIYFAPDGLSVTSAQPWDWSNLSASQATPGVRSNAPSASSARRCRQ
jgi:hypothetical protein